ncbi:hypothetical protein RRG08_050916 [Elysia crispata]|uniref:Apple domain-containing protein n=1 Tax=Elysia crispata TaxID=231223 RepID=A0AAE0ZSV8_9GAST|nr:hypothetical protein RRG08_050916 [Elysia crispata]
MWLRLLWKFSLLLSSSVAISNFFSFKSPSAWNNEAWGRYTYSYAEHTPLCGWKMIVSSSYTLDSISTWDSTNTRKDERTFLVTNLNYNANLLTSVQNIGGDITLRGPFGNTEPDVFITWYCVCTTISLGCVEVPYTTVPPFDATPAPPTTAVNDDTTQAPADTTTAAPAMVALANTATTAPATTASATVAPATAASLYIGYHILNPTKVFLQKQAGVCYFGSLLSRVFKVRHFMDCFTLCKDSQSCAGTNFWYNAHACDLVLEDTDLNPASFSTAYPGCHYWKVVWKA